MSRIILFCGDFSFIQSHDTSSKPQMKLWCSFYYPKYNDPVENEMLMSSKIP